jgi:hypothetical protein
LPTAQVLKEDAINGTQSDISGLVKSTDHVSLNESNMNDDHKVDTAPLQRQTTNDLLTRIADSPNKLMETQPLEARTSSAYMSD